MYYSGSIRQARIFESQIEVHAGLISSEELGRYIPEKSRKSEHYLIADSNVESLYAKPIVKCLNEAGIKVSLIVVPPSEHSKSLSCYGDVVDKILEQGVDKYSYIISVGGGVINNLAGFIASTVYRGIGLIHFPTTSLAQLDAAIDFKQAINDRRGKNLIGSYYPADYILVDLDVLSTLESRHLVNGLAESIKHALVQDVSLCEYLIQNSNLILSGDAATWEYVVTRTIVLKSELMSSHDESSVDEMIKQYGHPIGHAIEHLYLDDILHGEAVAIGMCFTAYLAHLRGYCTRDVFEYHLLLLEVYGLPVGLPDTMLFSDFYKVIKYDKHSVNGCPVVAFPQAIGALYEQSGMFSFSVGEQELEDAFNQFKALKS